MSPSFFKTEYLESHSRLQVRDHDIVRIRTSKRTGQHFSEGKGSEIYKTLSENKAGRYSVVYMVFTKDS